MDENNFDLSKINNKLVYSLSFILILYGLKDFMISWFPKDFSISLFNLVLTINDTISFMVLILFVSIYLYGVNYLFLNPLSKIEKFFNNFASILWFIFFIFPIFIGVILFSQEVFSSQESAIRFIPLIFVLLSILLSNWSQKQSRKMDLLILDKQIELLKSKSPNEDRTAEFLRYYLILESLIKRALVERIKIPISNPKSINLAGATNILLNHKEIKLTTKTILWDLWALRNKVIHEEYALTEKEIQKVKDAIRELDFDLKESENKEENANK
nr:hypothetical protein [Nanoarchaeum sp.]